MAIGTGAAILGSSLLGGAASLWGANSANNAAQANSANMAQNIDSANQMIYQYTPLAHQAWQNAADIGTNYLNQGYNANSNIYGRVSPYFQQGMNQMQGASIGMDPNIQANFQDFDPGNFEASPDYAFRKKEGLDAVEGSAAAAGGLYSGNTLKDITGYASNLASGEYGNWWNRQFNTAGFDANQEARRYGVDADNWNRNYMGANFEYGKGKDIANIGLGGMDAQAGLNYQHYGNIANLQGGVQSQYGNQLMNNAAAYSNNYLGGAGMMANNTPYYSPWGGINNAVQSGLQNWMWYGAQQPNQGVQPYTMQPGGSTLNYGNGSSVTTFPYGGG